MKKTLRVMIVSVLALSLPFIMFCAPVREEGVLKDGKVYGVTQGLFRAKWWNYYERGLSFAEGDFLNKAEKDFREALKQRENDQRRSRTYGMHFVDYFPHRELGIALLGMGRVSEAIQELETSLSTEESAKAKFYLNQARKKFLLSQPGPRDVTPPRMVLKSSDDQGFKKISFGGAGASTDMEKSPFDMKSSSPILTNGFFIDLIGDIHDESYVSSISVNGVPRFFELAEKKVGFKQRVELLPGSNTIVVDAEDLMGNRSRRSVEVTADHRGPQLSVINVMGGQNITRSPVEIKISFFDASGVDKVRLNHKESAPGGVKNGRFSAVVKLKPGKNTIAMVAVDKVGNKTRGEIILNYIPPQSHGKKRKPINSPLLVAWNAWGGSGSGRAVASDASPFFPATPFRDISPAISQKSFSHHLFASELKLAAQEEGVKAVPEIPSQIRGDIQGDTHPPEVILRGLLGAVQADSSLTMTGRRKDNRLLIEGQVSDLSGIATVLINDQPIVSSSGGKEVIFNRLVELVQGENTFYIKATDVAGNSVTREVHVHRRIQKIDMNESRISLSIMPFKNECISPALAESVYNLFVDRVVNDERFNVVVRGEALGVLLKELQLSQTDLVDKEKAVKAGRLIGSETIMFGKIIETPDSVEVFVHLTDTETSRIMAAHDVYDHKKERSYIEFLMQGLSSKFIYSLPLIEGKVLASKGNKYFLDLGKKKHAALKEGLKCIAYRSEPFIVDGMVLGEDITILGTLLLKNVQEKISIASLVPGESMEQGMMISKQDKVITK